MNHTHSLLTILLMLVINNVISVSAQEQDNPQEDGKYEIVTGPDGEEIRTWVYNDPEKREQAEFRRLTRNISLLASEGYGELLDYLPMEEVSEIVDFTLLDAQQSDVEAILEEYRKPWIGGDRSANDILRARRDAMVSLRKIIVPEQIATLALKAKRRAFTRYYSKIVASRSIEITDQQRQDVVRECEKLHVELQKTIEKIEALELECKQKYIAIHEKVFPNELKSKLERALPIRGGIENFVDVLTVKELFDDTNMKKLKEELKKRRIKL